MQQQQPITKPEEGDRRKYIIKLIYLRRQSRQNVNN